MATEEAAKRWKDELYQACWEVSCDAEQANPGTCSESEVIPPKNVITLSDWIDYLKLLKLAADYHGVMIRVSHEDGRVFVYDQAPTREDELDDLEDRRYEDAKDEALFGGG